MCGSATQYLWGLGLQLTERSRQEEAYHVGLTGLVIKEQGRSNVGGGRGTIPYSPVHLTAGEVNSCGGCLSEAACGSISALGCLPASHPCPVPRQHPVCLLQR